MSDERKVDVSADAVAVRVARLYSLEERGWIDTGVSDFIIALSAARDEAARERDRALEFEGRAMHILKENTKTLDDVAAQRDAALADLASPPHPAKGEGR